MTEQQINKILKTHSKKAVFKNAKIININGDYSIAFKKDGIIHKFDNFTKLNKHLKEN